jgi:hypothetical protein
MKSSKKTGCLKKPVGKKIRPPSPWLHFEMPAEGQKKKCQNFHTSACWSEAKHKTLGEGYAEN